MPDLGFKITEFLKQLRLPFLQQQLRPSFNRCFFRFLLDHAIESIPKAVRVYA